MIFLLKFLYVLDLFSTLLVFIKIFIVIAITFALVFIGWVRQELKKQNKTAHHSPPKINSSPSFDIAKPEEQIFEKPKRFFKVAGAFLPERQAILIDLVEKNKNNLKRNWNGKSNQKIKESGERFYEFNFMEVNSRAELRHEPENENDPNAIAIYVGRKKENKIGYVPKKDIDKVNSIMKEENRNSFKFRIGGGRFKQYNEILDKVEIVNGEYNGFVFFHDGYY